MRDARMKDEGLVVPLASRRRKRALLAQKLQHVFPAGVLLVAGLQEFVGEAPHGWVLALAIVEIVVGLMMLGALGHAVRRHRKGRHAHSHGEVEWENFIAAAMVLAEGWEHRLHGGHHFPRPALLTALVLVVTGLLHGRIMRAAQRRRSLRVSDERLYLPGRPFKAAKIDASWTELASIDIGERWAMVTTRTGRVRKVDLTDLDAEAEARAALGEAQRRFLQAQAPPNTAE
jgi:hypothetical protein